MSTGLTLTRYAKDRGFSEFATSPPYCILQIAKTPRQKYTRNYRIETFPPAWVGEQGPPRRQTKNQNPF